MAHLEEGWFESPEGTSTPRLEPPRVYRPAEADDPLDGPEDGFQFELAGGGSLLGNEVPEASGPDVPEDPSGPPRRWSRMDSAADLEAWLQERRADRAASRQREAAPLPPPAEAEPPAAGPVARTAADAAAPTTPDAAPPTPDADFEPRFEAEGAHVHDLGPEEAPDLESADWLAEVPVEEGAVDDAPGAGWDDEDSAWTDAARVRTDEEETWDDEVDGEADPAWAEGPGDRPGAAAPHAPSDEPAWADAPFEGAAEPAWSEAAPEPIASATPADAAWEDEGSDPAEDDLPWAQDEAPDARFDDAVPEDGDVDGEEDEEDDGRVVRARPASYGAHALAWTVDGLLVVGLAATLLWLAGRVVGEPAGLASIVSAPTTVVAALLVAAVMGVFYTAGFTVAGGQTLGGRLAGVTVLDGSGFPPPLGRAFLRAVLAVPGVLIVGVGLAWVVFDEHGQSLHDRISRTWAVEIE